MFVEGDHGIKFLEGLVADFHAACDELITSVVTKVTKAGVCPAVTVTAGPGSALAGWADLGDTAKPKANL